MTQFEVLISKPPSQELLTKTLESVEEQVYQAHRITFAEEGSFEEELRALNANPESVIVPIRGGDWLLDAWVLEYLDGVYEQGTVDFIYTQHISAQTGKLGSSKRAPSRIRKKNAYRKLGWVYGPLQTFRYSLFQQCSDGMQGDFKSTIFSLLEGAGTRVRYFPEIFYVAGREVK